MATINHPLLHTPETSHQKTICLVLSLVAILSSTTLVNINYYSKIIPTTPPGLLQNPRDHGPDQSSFLAILITQIASNTTTKMNHVNLLQFLLEKSTPDIQNIIEKAKDVSRLSNDLSEQAALLDCVELMELSIRRIKDSIVALESVKTFNRHVHTWLSSVLANHDTCLDGLNGSARSTMELGLNNLIMRARIFLAILDAVSPLKRHNEIMPLYVGCSPSWLTFKDRKILEALSRDIMVDVIVREDRNIYQYQIIEKLLMLFMCKTRHKRRMLRWERKKINDFW